MKFFSSFIGFFTVLNYEEYGHNILIKSNDVLKSCKTQDQYNMSRNYSRIAFDNIRSYINTNDKSMTPKSHYYLFNLAKAINIDFRNKANELNIEYKQLL